MHFHLVAGLDIHAITHEAIYDDLEKSLDDFAGIVDNLYQSQVCGKVETAKANMRYIAQNKLERIVYIGSESPIKLFWFACSDCKKEEIIPCRN